MSKYLVTVSALADVWTYVVVEATDPAEARNKAVREARQSDAEWREGERAPLFLDATRVELMASPSHEPENNPGAKTGDTILARAS
jgi:hypothetical protein